MCSIDGELIQNFRQYLLQQKQSPHTIRNKIQYVKRFYYVLEKNNAQDLLSVSPETRQHAMKSLASLSKFMGIYDRWQNLIKRFQLKWPKKEAFAVFNEIFNNSNESYTDMLSWIKESVSALPTSWSNVIVFNTLTGLRPDEGYKAMELINSDTANYVDRARMLLLHYNYPDSFLRVSKNAYVSVINENIIRIARNSEPITSYRHIRNTFGSYSISMNMYYCRKVFATFLRNEGIEPEIIDLLQGRIPNSVFVRHYYRPDSSKFDEIRSKLDKLHGLLVN
jgi:intergrase/recombinase